MIKSAKIAFIIRVVSLLIAVFGLLSMMGVFENRFLTRSLMYYTIQSNILGIVLFTMLCIRTLREVLKPKQGNVSFFPRFEMVCVLNIFLTFIVYWLLLFPAHYEAVGSTGIWSFGNLAVHGITPLLCLLDYILFTQPRHLKYRDIYYVCIFPVSYLIITSTAGLLGYIYSVSSVDDLPVRFPYFFFDFDRIGVFSLVYIGSIVVFFLILGHIMYYIDIKIRNTK